MSRKTVKSKTNATQYGSEEPKRLSKMGEWRLKNPNGIGEIIDMRAVMK
jgi:hypothetical protein